jgi:hypothetical protein
LNFAGWDKLGTVTNVGANVTVIDPTATNFNSRIYRALLKP